MKRFIIMAAATILILPAVSYAGSADSRWDLTVGGFIKFDMGYATQGVNADYNKAARGSYGSYESREDEYGSLFAAGGETRLNFFVKGPDGWGAKTSGFVEAEFRGQTGDYGELNLRHAYMRMKWANDTLTIGQTWQKWGYLPTHSNILLGVNMLEAFVKGKRQPQITWDHQFNKNYGFSLGVLSPTNTLGSRSVDDFANSPYPFIQGELLYTSDACGKIGSWQMLFGISGFYGWERKVYDTDAAATVSLLDDDLNNAWGIAIKGLIPIIPERKGNKAGALSVSGILFAAQNPGWHIGSFAMGAYNRGTATNPDYAYPRLSGGWGQVSYWFTNNLFITGWAGQMRYGFSDRYKTLNRNSIEREQQYLVNLSYDVNPAMRFGIEWDYIKTRYANYSSATTPYFDKSGKVHAVRIGAWYFF